jgi:tetratricopeptide (TPR) repeat protein
LQTKVVETCADAVMSLFRRLEGTPLTWMSAVPAIVAAATFANTLPNEFVYDDLLTADRLRHFEPSPESVFRPRGLTYVLHNLDAIVWGGWTTGSHITNVLLHSVASLLAALAAFVLTRSRRAGLMCGLFFAVHPIHSEVVASFAYRKDALAMVFVSMALILWQRSHQRVLAYIGALLCFGLAVMAKEVAAAALPIVLFLSDLVPSTGAHMAFGRRLLRGAARALPLAVLGTLAAALLLGTDPSSFTRPGRIARVTEGQCVDYKEVAATAAALVPDHGRLLLFPQVLSADYSVGDPGPPSGARAAYGLSLALLWIAIAVWTFHRMPVAGFAMLWVPVMLLPAANLIPVSHFFIADRYLYVPSFGICLLVAIGVDRLFRYGQRRSLRFAYTGAVVAVLVLLFAGAIRSTTRNRDWHDGYALWSAAKRDGMHTLRVHNNLGVALAGLGRIDEAIAEFSAALELNRGFGEARSNLAKIHMQLATAATRSSHTDDAVEHLAKVLKLEPGHAVARMTLAELVAGAARSRPTLELPTLVTGNYALGSAALAHDNEREAEMYLATALRMDPDHGSSHNGLGVLRLRQGMLDEAADHLGRATRLLPVDPEPRNNLGLVFARRGEFDSAARLYAEALRTDPRYPEAHNNMGVALSTQGRPHDAVRHFKSAVRANPDYASAYSNLASAYANLGRTGEAIDHYREAVRLEPDYVRAHLKLARTLADDGQVERAARHFREALRIEPGLEAALDGLRDVEALRKR